MSKFTKISNVIFRIVIFAACALSIVTFAASTSFFSKLVDVYSNNTNSIPDITQYASSIKTMYTFAGITLCLVFVAFVLSWFALKASNVAVSIVRGVVLLLTTGIAATSWVMFYMGHNAVQYLINPLNADTQFEQLLDNFSFTSSGIYASMSKAEAAGFAGTLLGVVVMVFVIIVLVILTITSIVSLIKTFTAKNTNAGAGNAYNNANPYMNNNANPYTQPVNNDSNPTNNTGNM